MVHLRSRYGASRPRRPRPA